MDKWKYKYRSKRKENIYLYIITVIRERERENVSYRLNDECFHNCYVQRGNNLSKFKVSELIIPILLKQNVKLGNENEITVILWYTIRSR